MEAFKTLIWIVNIFSSLAVITLVLMQHGKGADAGANFSGSGSAQGVFGSGGNANFLTRMTSLAALVFFATCLALGYINTNSSKKAGELDFSNVQQTTQKTAPMPHNTASAVAAPQMQDSLNVATASSTADTANMVASSPAIASEATAVSSPVAAAVATTTAVAAKAVADGASDSAKTKKSVKTSNKPTAEKTDKKATANKTSDKDKSDKSAKEKKAAKTTDKSDKKAAKK